MRAEEIHLRLVGDAENPAAREFELLVTDIDGTELTIRLDGVQVGDLLDDARRCGMPASGPFTAGGLHEDGPPDAIDH